MRDDLGRSDVTKVRACLQRQSTRYSEQKSRRILVAGTGCIENLIDRLSIETRQLIDSLPITTDPFSLRVTAATAVSC